jgi:hypothetical protein
MGNTFGYNRNYWLKNKEKIMGQRNERYANDPDFRQRSIQRTIEWRRKNPDKYRNYIKISFEKRKKRIGNRRRELKTEVIQYYSEGRNKCNCCGEKTIDFLTVDHITPLSKTREGRNSNFYLWLKKNGFPKGYQILCFNCNFAKRDKEICPHQLIT